MLQPRRREAVRRPHNNGLIYTTLVVLLSVATFNYAVGLALAESDISNQGQSKEVTSSSSSSSSSSGNVEAIVGAVDNGPLNHHSNEQPDIVVANGGGGEQEEEGRRHNKKLVPPVIGLVSTTERTFIDNGVTTQYGTAVYGTEIKNGEYYVQFLTTNTKILYENQLATKSAAEELKRESASENIFNGDNDFDIGNVHTILIQPKSPLPAYLERTKATPALEEKDSEAEIVTSVVTSSSSSSSTSSSNKDSSSSEKKKGKSLNLAEEEKLFKFNEILPTFTVAQEGILYETATISANAEEPTSARTNKALDVDNFFVGSELEAANEAAANNEAIGELKSTTYYGFSEFTTTVGDTRIVFLPSSQTPDGRDGITNNIAPTATWTSEVKTVDASVMMPQQQQQQPALPKFKPKVKLPSLKDRTSTTTTTTTTTEEPSTTTTTTEKTVEDNEIIKQVKKAESLATTPEQLTEAPKILSTPTDEEIIKIFNSLKMAEMERERKKVEEELLSVAVQETTEEASSTSMLIDATPASKETLINSGVTTIFFEPDFEDPFAVIEREEQEKKAQQQQQEKQSAEEALNSTTEDNLPTTMSDETGDTVVTSADEEATTLKLETTSKATESLPTTTEKRDEEEDETTTTPEEITTMREESTEKAKESADDEDKCAKLIITTTIPTFKTVTLLTTLLPEDRVETNVVTSTELNKLTITPAIYLDLGCQATKMPSTTVKVEAQEVPQTTTEQKPEEETTESVTEKEQEEEKEEEVEEEAVVEKPAKKQYASIDRPRSTTESSDNDVSINSRFNEDEVTENVVEIVTEKKHVTSSSDEVTESGDAAEATTLSQPEEETGEQDAEEGDSENIIFKTLYTTYTYLTTFFQESTSSVSSRKEIVTNVVKSTIPAGAASQMGLEFIEATPTDNVGVGRPTILAFDQFDALFGSTDDEEDDSAAPLNGEGVDSGNGIKTYYTTYTYFTTIFVDGETEVSSRTEVYTNFVTPTKVLDGVADEDMKTKAMVSMDEVEESLINENRVGKSYNTMIRKIDEDVDNLEMTSEESVTKMVTNTRNSTSKVDNIIEMVEKEKENPAPIPDQDESESKNYEKKLHDGGFLDASEEEIRPTALALTDSKEDANKTTTLLLQTSYTTFTYFTTMYVGTESSNVLSRLETVTNIVTETLKEPSPSTVAPAELKTKLNEIDNNAGAADSDALAAADELDKDLPITYFTTFTYWTTIFKDGNTITTSREETVSNVIEPTSTVAAAVDNSDLKTAKVLLEEEEKPVANEKKKEEDQPKIESTSSVAIVDAIKPTSITTYYTTFTFYTTSYIGEETVVNSHFETVTKLFTPTIEPSLATDKVSPTSRALNLGETIEDVRNELDEKIIKPTSASAGNTPPLDDFVNTANLLRINYGRIVDSENVSTIHYKTLTLATTIDNIQAEVLQSTRSIEVDEKRKAELATVEKESGNLKTGLVRQIDGTIVNKDATNVLTQYQSKIIGTVIDGRYAQIIESRTDIITPTATKTATLETLAKPVKLPELQSSKGQEPAKGTENDEEETTEENEADEEEEDEEGRPKSRLSFQQRKKTFTPIIRPFASRARPTFAPKRKQLNTNAGPQTVTRSDVTPTITATPALSNSPSNVRTRLRGSSSKQFAYRSSSSLNSASVSASGIPSSSRGRFQASRSSNSIRITPTLSRPGSLRSSIGGGAARPLLTPSSRINRFRSSSLNFGGISASRTEQILKTKAITTTTEAPSDDNAETATDNVDETPEEVQVPETTTSKNPLLNRFRRPPISSLRSGPRVTTTTTTTTTPKPKRTFKRPPVLNFQPSASPAAAPTSGNISPSERFSRTRANNLFPARGLFKTSTTTTEAPQDEDDEDFVDEDGEQTLSRKKRQLYHSRLRTTPTQKPAARKKFEEEYEVEYIEYYDDEPVATTPKRPTARGPSFRGRNAATQAPATTQRATTLRASNIRASNPQNFRQQFTIRDNSYYKPPTTQAPVVTTPSRKRPSLTGARNNRVSTTRKSTPPTSRSSRLRPNTNNSYKSSYNRNTAATTRSSNARGGSNLANGRSRGRNNYNQNIGATNTFVENPYLDSTAITVTHQIPSEVTIPYQDGGRTEYKTVVTLKQSTEVIPRKSLKTYQNTLFLNKESTLVNPQNGATEVIQYYLQETETTSVIFTPTTIRGRRTSYSHVVPSTVYNVEMTTVTQVPSLADSIANPAAPLANILLSQLLLGNLGGGVGNNLNQNLGIPGLNPLAGLPGQAPVDLKPHTEYKTRTTTYVTTLTDQKSTVLPLTFHGKQILTTIYDSSQNVITATEYITDTIVITPTPAVQQIQQTQPQFNSLLLPLLLQQQQQQQQPQPQIVPQQPQQDQLQQLAQLLPKDNFVDTNDQLQSQELEEEKPKPVVVKKAPPPPPAVKPKKIIPQNTEVITLYVSGRKPGEFSTVLSTIISGGGEERRKRDVEEFVRDEETPELEATENAFSGHHIQTRALDDLVHIDSTKTILFGVEPSDGPQRIYQTAEHFLA